MMLCVIEYFVKSLKVIKVIRNDTVEKSIKSLLAFRCIYLYLVPFLRYSALNNDVTLKTGLGIVQRH